MMRRKAIQLASNTLVVSLPAKWVKSNGIEKGAELDIDAKENLLTISRGSANKAARKVKIDISGMSSSLVWNYLNAIYRTGSGEVEIFFKDRVIKDIKSGKSHKVMDLISRITDKLVGMEIIRQSKNSCVLKEITRLKGDEYDNVINRIFLSLRNMSQDLLSAASDGDVETLEDLYRYSEVNLNKLSDYCMRILNTQGLEDFLKSNTNYVITFLLEEVGDAYAEIARIISADKRPSLQPYSTDFLEKTNELLVLSHKFFLSSKKEQYISFHEQRNDIKKKIDSQERSGRYKDLKILFWLKIILDRLMEVNNAKVTCDSDSQS